MTVRTEEETAMAVTIEERGGERVEDDGGCRIVQAKKEMETSVMLKRLGVPCGETLFGKTIFIMGYGNIGVELAKRLRPFDVRILATKRCWSSLQCNARNNYGDDFVDERGSHGDIYKFAGMADIVICCLTLNHETGAYLVNVARGGLLDYEAIANGLRSGHFGGLAMDVAWTEPFDPNDPILQFPNVIVTPHVAGVTQHSFRSTAKVVGDVALQLHQGKYMTSTAATGVQFVN